MLAVVAPQPTLDLPPPAIYSIMTNQPLGALTPQCLQSPILLNSRLRSPLCSTPHRRRTARPRRRRHCARSECPIESALHPFDRLPWISAMDAIPDAFDLADIADLSQLVVDEPSPAVPPTAGPIRRRKTSLRSNPLAPKLHNNLHETTPHTPLSHYNPSRITFHNLMPLPMFSCDHTARS
ncbi:hypothetical protein B0H16DRAFT_1361784 [Mycena metata]|uniref:Uncharacterized protein n=1 Tax=Mycena metata TaxID=1033252 RepID=A0AAD7JYL3_9AGAR|nr:hypothetical protein B0H16DRAFT_1361784 [Mycena metata]